MEALAARVERRLRDAPQGAIILERIARGAGATNWFACRDRAQLDEVMAELWPGNCVSFYFDGRISSGANSTLVQDRILEVVAETGECVVGHAETEVRLEVDFITAASELWEFVALLGPEATIYFGPFPARDNDGRQAITVVLPDRDGVIRPHPH
jgi:hypothetical protein